MQHVIPTSEKMLPQAAKSQYFMLLFALSLMLFFAGCDEGGNAFYDISGALPGTTKARLDTDNHTLFTEGKGEKGQTVTLRIPDSGVVVGVAMVSDKGEWSLQVVGLRDIPCQLDVEVGAVRVETDIEGACD